MQSVQDKGKTRGYEFRMMNMKKKEMTEKDNHAVNWMNQEQERRVEECMREVELAYLTKHTHLPRERRGRGEWAPQENEGKKQIANKGCALVCERQCKTREKRNRKRYESSTKNMNERVMCVGVLMRMRYCGEQRKITKAEESLRRRKERMRR